MKDNFKFYTIVLFLLSIVPLAIYVGVNQQKWDETTVQNWAAENGYSFVEMRSVGLWDGCPFYRTKGTRTYKGTLQDQHEQQRECWFRLGGVWGLEHQWAD